VKKAAGNFSLEVNSKNRVIVHGIFS
jgi:hypothetical protein